MPTNPREFRSPPDGRRFAGAAHPALVTSSGVWTHAELARRVEGEKRWLVAQGLAPGTRVLLDIPPATGAWVLGLLSGLAAGLQMVLPDPAWSEGDRRHCLDLVKPAASLQGGHVLRPQRGPGTPKDGPPGGGVWLFTSGTTSQPQPRFRSLAALTIMLERLGERLPPSLADARPACLLLAPLYHGYGLISGLTHLQVLGGTVVLPPGKPGPTEIMELLARHRVGVLYGWPSHFAGLVHRALWRAADRVSLSWCVSSSLSLPQATADAFAELSGCPLRQQYGTTETGPLCLDADEPPSGRTDCVGKPLAGVEIRARDEQGGIVPPGREGRLAVVFQDPALRELLAGATGPWYTGDIGTLDSEGRVYVRGRYSPFHDERKEVVCPAPG